MKKCPHCSESRDIRSIPSRSRWERWLLKPLFWKSFYCGRCGRRFRRISLKSHHRTSLNVEPEWQEFPKFLKSDNRTFDDVMREMRDFERRFSIRKEDPSKSTGRRSGESLTVITNPGKGS